MAKTLSRNGCSFDTRVSSRTVSVNKIIKLLCEQRTDDMCYGTALTELYFVGIITKEEYEASVKY